MCCASCGMRSSRFGRERPSFHLVTCKWFGDLNSRDNICFHLTLPGVSNLCSTTTCDLNPLRPAVITYENAKHASFLKKKGKIEPLKAVKYKTMSSLLGKEDE